MYAESLRHRTWLLAAGASLLSLLRMLCLLCVLGVLCMLGLLGLLWRTAGCFTRIFQYCSCAPPSESEGGHPAERSSIHPVVVPLSTTVPAFTGVQSFNGHIYLMQLDFVVRFGRYDLF